MTTRYVPEQYADLAAALLASGSDDEIVLNTSRALGLYRLDFSALSGITIRAGVGFSPVLEHTALDEDETGIVIGDDWTLTGLRFRDGNARSVAIGTGESGVSGLALVDCWFEGQKVAIEGEVSGLVSRCTFRHVGKVVESGELMRVEACEFIQCIRYVDGAIVRLSATGSAVESCTLSRCRVGDGIDAAGSDMIAADIVQGNSAYQCGVLLGPGIGEGDFPAIFRGESVCRVNNAFECISPALFTPSGVEEDNTELDPAHVNPLTDLRLGIGSQLVGAAIGLTTEADRFGMAYFVDPSIGAHESARIYGLFVADESTIVLLVAGLIEAYGSPGAWEIEALDGGVRVAVRAVLDVSPFDANASVVVLSVHPVVSPGCEYAVTLRPDRYGEARNTAIAELEIGDYPLNDYRNIGAVANAIGLRFREMIGPVWVELAYDFEPGDTSIFVTSTLDLPDAATIWLAQYRVTYTSKTDGTLHGLTINGIMLSAIPRGTRGVLDEASATPPAG